MGAKQKPAGGHSVRLLVHAPMCSREILQALRDWEPYEGVRFTLAKRESCTLLFEVATASSLEARGLALARLREKGLDQTPKMEIVPYKQGRR